MDRQRHAHVHGATLTRRQFVKTGGALVVGVALLGRRSSRDRRRPRATGKNSLDARLASSWFEIHADNTILMRTGKVDFGQSTAHTAYRQIVAEELSVPFEAITTVVMGDTDRTPDGGFSAGYIEYGGTNLRKAAAYTYQALLDLAATTLNVDKKQLSVKDGIVSGGGKSVSYGDLVRGQELKLTIPVTGDLTSMFGLTVTGDPPMKPVAQYTVVGKSYANAVTPAKVVAKELWVTDVRLPDMLHGRVVHPKTLGSTLVAAGTIDKAQFPNARVIVKGNLVGVVAPDGVGGHQGRAGRSQASTTWTDWKGLPGHRRSCTPGSATGRLEDHAGRRRARRTTARLPTPSSGPSSFTASYELPFMKHAPIGPTVAVGDVGRRHRLRAHAQPEPAGAARTDGDDARHVGRQRRRAHLRGAGALRAIERRQRRRGRRGRYSVESAREAGPRAVDARRRLMWSTQSPAAFSDIRLAWDAHGTVTAYQADHYMPAMQDDRLVGAVIAGLPTPPRPRSNDPIASTSNAIQDPWLYGRVPNVAESGHGTFQVGQKSSPLGIGLRDHSMRTPGQLQQNFPREVAFSEAAARAGVDAIEFRLKQTDDARLIGVLKAAREASGWETRTSPAPHAKATGTTRRDGTGRLGDVALGHLLGVCLPGQRRARHRQGRGDEIHDRGGSWDRHQPDAVEAPDRRRRTHGAQPRAARRDDVRRERRHEPRLANVSDPDDGRRAGDQGGDPEPSGSRQRYGGGSEAANALAVSAIAAAFFDATGRPARKLPLRPEYVQAMLKART